MKKIMFTLALCACTELPTEVKSLVNTKFTIGNKRYVVSRCQNQAKELLVKRYECVVVPLDTIGQQIVVDYETLKVQLNTP